MTWEDVRRRVAADIQKIPVGSKGYGSDTAGWTRQALSRHPTIGEAFARRGKELREELTRDQANPRRNRNPELVLLRRERDALRVELDEARRKLAVYEERFCTLEYNRTLGATTESEMNRPLPSKMDRRGRV